MLVPVELPWDRGGNSMLVPVSSRSTGGTYRDMPKLSRVRIEPERHSFYFRAVFACNSRRNEKQENDAITGR